MKRVFPVVTVIILLIAPFGGYAAAPLAESTSSARLDTMPGSVTRFEHITIEDGLSQNTGLAIFQDSKGYLWVGTQDGLNRYDGYTFRIYKHDPDDPNSISHNSILALEEDQDGYLWIGTRGGGLNRFDPASGTFTQYRHESGEWSSLSNDTVTSIKREFKRGTLGRDPRRSGAL